jgi:hypothetical protein
MGGPFSIIPRRWAESLSSPSRSAMLAEAAPTTTSSLFLKWIAWYPAGGGAVEGSVFVGPPDAPLFVDIVKLCAALQLWSVLNLELRVPVP